MKVRGESVGELIEKLVIANIKLWMVKDAQTAFLNKSKNKQLLKHLCSLTRIEELSISPQISPAHYKKLIQKLTKVLNKKEMILIKDLIRKDIELCEARSYLRRNINFRLQDKTPTDTIKKYGGRK